MNERIGIIKEVDNLGRLVIPKEMRDTLHIGIGTPLEFYSDNEGIVLKKYIPDDFSEKVKELKCMLNDQIENIGLDQCIKIEDELDKIQKILDKSDIVNNE